MFPRAQVSLLMQPVHVSSMTLFIYVAGYTCSDIFLYDIDSLPNTSWHLPSIFKLVMAEARFWGPRGRRYRIRKQVAYFQATSSVRSRLTDELWPVSACLSLSVNLSYKWTYALTFPSAWLWFSGFCSFIVCVFNFRVCLKWLWLIISVIKWKQGDQGTLLHGFFVSKSHKKAT